MMGLSGRIAVITSLSINFTKIWIQGLALQNKI